MSQSTNPKPLVFVTVGTDHHPFDRLVDWIDAWLQNGGGQRVRCVVQHGTSRESRLATSTPFLDFQDVEASLREAAAVVCHGGPGTIMLAAHMGKRPIVVPRRRSLAEHVDDHQVLFSARLAAEGTIVVAETAAALHELLARSLDEGSEARPQLNGGSTAQAVDRIEQLVDGLLAERPARRRPC